MITTSKEITDEGYSTESWEAFEEALANAEQVADDESATQEDVESAEEELKAAIDNLVKVAAKIGDTEYTTLSKAFSGSKAGDTITVEDDTVTDAVLNIATKKTGVTIDLNGHEISNETELFSESDGKWSLISCKGSATITGNGTLKGLEGDCFAADVQKGGTLTIEDGEFYGGDCHVIYAYEGTVYINGGTYQLLTPDSKYGYGMTLNCYDANRKAGTASIVVTGGKFYQFDPANNIAEGEGTNFVAEGYKSVQDGDWYIVEPED